MNSMKKHLSLLLAALMAMSATACAGGEAETDTAKVYQAQSTEYVSKWEAIQQKAQTALDEALVNFAALGG